MRLNRFYKLIIEMKIFVLIIVTSLYFTVLIYAQSAEWIEGEGEIILTNITPEEAHREALIMARTNVLSSVRLEVVSITSWLITESLKDGNIDSFNDIFSRFTRSIVKGLIVEENILFSGIENKTVEGLDIKIPVYRVKIRARVVTEEKDPDPSFMVNISLNQTSFRHGESMILNISATKDCYVSIFNIYSSDSLRVILPNEFVPDNHLYSDEPLVFPAPDTGFEMLVLLPEYLNEDVEALMAVATKDDIPFTTTKAVTIEKLLAMEEAFTSISNWLVNIPIDRRTEGMVTYRIVR